MKPGVQFGIIAGLAGVTTILHYSVDPHAGAIHDILQRVYFLPVILGGLWFGVRGGLLTAFSISVVYFPHAFHGWSGPHTLFFRMSEITMYHVIGGLTGFLSSRVGNALKAEQHARQEREAAYRRLRERTEELFALEEQLRRSERLAALGRLTAGLAHEIRNPLASIKTSVELLQERVGQREGMGPEREAMQSSGNQDPDLLGVLLEETDRLDRILTSFLAFARAEGKKDTAEPARTRLSDAVSRTGDLLDAQMKKRAIRLDARSETLAYEVGVPESQLRQVLLNLFLNAIDAMPGGGTIRVEPVAAAIESGLAGVVEFAVEDSGPGITADVAPHIFDPFYTTKETGTGLGLSIVERILTSHGGQIRLDTTRLPTSRFVISIPLASESNATT